MAHLASGGMADVLLGRTEGLEGFQRHVVLKRIRPEHAHDQRFIRMLLAEARVAATLHHHNIVQVHDVGEDSGEYFLAMEYLHGEDLRTILARAAKQRVHVPLDHAIAIVSAAAAGLHYAHERRDSDNRPLGIVHRDISPSNLLVSYDGSVKIVDFGIAKAVAAVNEETQSGHLRGKISYMSPEQCRGDRIDRRSDIYALGVVLYEIATTKRLFKGDNNYRLMEAIVHGHIVDPRARRPELPAKLCEIIMRALATDPEQRFATAEDLRVALDQLSRRLGFASSAPAIAAYMRDQFGDRPEPWVHLDSSLSIVAPRPAPPRFDEPSRSRTASTPWQTVSIAAPAARPAAPLRRPGTERYVEAPALPPPPPAPAMVTLRPMEEPPPPPMARPVARRSSAVLALIAVPVVVVLGLVIWRLAAGPGDAAAVVASGPASTSQPGVPATAPAATTAGTGTPSAATPATTTPAGATSTAPATTVATPAATTAAARTATTPASPNATTPASPNATTLAAPNAKGATPAARDSTGPARVATATDAAAKSDAAAREEARNAPRPDSAASRRAAVAKRAETPATTPAERVATAPAPLAPIAHAAEPPPPPAVVEAPAPAPVVAHNEPAPASTPALVPLDANRIGGDKNIVPDDLTQTEVRRRGMERLIGIYKVCITASGDINSVSQVKSTGFAAYDRKIQTTIRATWRYRPFLVNGQASAVCSAVQLAYVAQG